MNGLEPILCAPLIRRVDEELLALLPQLTTEEWELPTVAPAWRVHDIVGHLLDTALRKLSFARDRQPFRLAHGGDIVALVNNLNREGVTVYGRLSAPVLIDLMTVACQQTAAFYESLDPFAEARIGVSWAGEGKSFNWFDTAREFTERWHHQQQIRLATNRPGILTPELYHPVLDCFLRALPFHYRDVEAPLGATLAVEVSGDCGGEWWLSKQRQGWAFDLPPRHSAHTRVVVPQSIAWRLFTKGIERQTARRQIRVEGNVDIGEKILDLVAIVG